MESLMILNGENRGALGAVRSLGKRGIPLFVGGNKVLARACFSKYCKKRFKYTPSCYGTQKIHESIIKNVKRLKPDILFPLYSDTVYTVLKNIDKYEKYCKVIPFIDFKKFNIINDKESMIKEVKKFGCTVPKTYFPNKLGELQKISKRIDYPVLIKPRIASTARGIVKVFSPSELIKQYILVSNQKKIDLFYDPMRPIIQEFIPNKITYTVYVLFNKGKHVVSMVGENHRHYPVPFGAPISNITVANEKVRMLAIKLFKKLKWHGSANVLFIIDPRDNVPKMIEINPRLSSIGEMSTEAGIDFPYMLYKLAIGEKIKETIGYVVNQRFRWILFGELFYFLKSENKLKILKDYLNFKNTKTEIDFTDIKPHLIHLLDLCINRQVL